MLIHTQAKHVQPSHSFMDGWTCFVLFALEHGDRSMPRRNNSNHRVEQGLPKLKGYTQQPEVTPDPTVPMVAHQTPDSSAGASVGAPKPVTDEVPRSERTWPPRSTPPPPPPSLGQQPPLHPASGRATHTDANGVGNDGRRIKQAHSGPADETQCYWNNATCTAAPTPGKRFCPAHFREYREQRRGWSD